MKSITVKKEALLYLKGYIPTVCFLLLAVVLGTVFSSIAPVFYGRLVDIITNRNNKEFIYILCIYAGILLISVFISSIEEFETEVLGDRIYKEHQKILLDKMLQSKYEKIEKLEIGELMSYLTADIGTIIQYDMSVVTTFSFIAFNMLIPLVLLFMLNYKMAILSLFFIPISVFIYKIFKKKRKQVHRKYRECEDYFNSFVINILENLPSIKSYRIEYQLGNQFHHLTNKIYAIEKKGNGIDSIVSFLNNINNIAFQILFLFLSNKFICEGSMTIGSMITLGMYINKVHSSVDMLQKIQLNEQMVSIALQRIKRIRELPDDGINLSTSFDSEKSFGLEIKNISFKYDKSECNVLEKLSLEITSPGLYSIVGKNGTGKSTLLKILLCFYSVKSGIITINGCRYDECSTSYIRSHITYVQKEPFILRDSLLENIRLYADIDDDIIHKYCNMVGLQEAIATLPNGINSIISEDTLSSGQRQKLSFARALAHKTDIIMFDEITSDLDGVSENNLTDIMKRLSETAIVISISHRLLTVSKSDYIYVLDSGSIISHGTFEYVKQHCMMFNDLFNIEK